MPDFGDYFVELTDNNGCVQQAKVNLSNEQCETCPLYMANAFSPNNNGLNETYSPQHICEFTDYKFAIFSRWGEKLFETYDPEAVWDGKYKGESCQQDVYMWALFYIDKSTLKSISQSGTVTLLR